MSDAPIVLVRGGGDLGSGCAIRLFRAGLRVVIAEIEAPLAVRRTVSFSDAVYEGWAAVEGVTCLRVASLAAAGDAAGETIVLAVSPRLEDMAASGASVLVDATMSKRGSLGSEYPLPSVGLGPGFVAGDGVAAVVETNRGPDLGRVLWTGSAQPNTHKPAPVQGHSTDRVLRSPAPGSLTVEAEIGTEVAEGDTIASVDGRRVTAPFRGLVRGLLRHGSSVAPGQKIGDIDPRLDPDLCQHVSDKALAVAGGAVEACLILLRRQGLALTMAMETPPARPPSITA